MDQLVQYHRCFVDVTENAITRHNMWVGEQTWERVPVGGSVAGFGWTGNSLQPLDLYAKPNQNFNAYATGFEERCSVLVRPSGFVRPIVDKKATLAGLPVVAHLANVGGQFLVAPAKYSGSIYELNRLVEKGVPVYVVSDAMFSYTGEFRRLSGAHSTTVLTDLDGKVLHQVSVGLNDDSIQSVDPTTVLAVAALALVLRKIGTRVVTGMIRRISGGGNAPQRIFLPEGATEHVVVSQEGQILARTSDTMLPHPVFVQRTVGALPPGAWVGTFGKYQGRIEAMASGSFGPRMPAPPWVMEALLRTFH